MLGGVPISVIIPPIDEAKAMGINILLGDIPAAVERLTTIGNNKATVPEFETKAPIPDVTNIIRINMRSSLPPAIRNIFELIIRARPVWKMAPPTTNRPTIIITTGLENADNASCGVITPPNIKHNNETKATTSDRTLPTTKATAVKTKTTIVYIITLSIFRKHTKKLQQIRILKQKKRLPKR
jgi:hypothetical protein